MNEIGSFAGVIALWIGISCGLWWLQRRSVHGRQKREIDQATRAAGFAAEAPAIFDSIRTRASLPSAPAAAGLAAETLALLKRIQDHGEFFDRVNALRVQMQASFDLDDYQPLSEILHMRRDLWAASEIVLVEDLSSFGSSFAEEGSYERFRSEAVALLFKTAGSGSERDDVIDLRLSLAHQDAERFIAELMDAIVAARERDRLPTPSEIIAYPVATIRAIPAKLRLARNFLSAFFAYAGDIAASIRDSETMERGRRHLQTAREELPQRLSAGFDHASIAALESVGHLRRHYDFLVAAHDFQAKYEQVLRRAPELTERGRQFMARLELAERSERLRLTSANVMIWIARRLVDGLAHLIAGLQILFAALSRTTPYAFVSMLLAPAPANGRRTSSFLSFQMALAASGLREEQLPARTAPLQRAVAPKSKSAANRAKLEEMSAREKTAKSKTAAPARAKPKKQRGTVSAKAAAEQKAIPKTVAPDASEAKNEAAIAPTPTPVSQAPQPRPRKPVADRPTAISSKGEAPKNAKAAKPAAPLPPAQSSTLPTEAGQTSTSAPKPAAAQTLPVEPAARQDVGKTGKRRSFFARLFAGGEPKEREIDAIESLLGEVAARYVESRPAAPDDHDPFAIAAAPAETKPTLLARLSEIGNETEESSGAGDEQVDESLDAEPAEDADEAANEPGPLTSSLTELRTKGEPKPSPIRSFPWLRGY